MAVEVIEARGGKTLNVDMASLDRLLFWVPFVLIFFSTVLGIFFPDVFYSLVSGGKEFILAHFSWLISSTGLFCLLVVGVAYFSRFGTVRIGGKNAKPVLTKWQWFSITLCTTIAVNILFWPIVEPLQDILTPPSHLGLVPNSYNAAKFALSAMYMNWGIIPYAINALPALVFAICFYNVKLPFSLGSILYPVLGKRANGRIGNVVDIVSLYALALGMGTSLGTAALLLSRGLSRFIPEVASMPVLWAGIIATVIVLCIITSISGVARGIRIVSEVNTKLFFMLILFVFLCGPTVFILDLSVESLGLFLDNFFTNALLTDSFRVDSWPQQWTVFSFSNYMIWAPISALFLGRIARGYTVREFINTNVLLPVTFVYIHSSVFSSTAIWQQLFGGTNLQESITTGIDAAVYILLENLPLSEIVVPVFLLIALISFITAANSTTNAMASLTTKNLSADNQEAPVFIKVAWSVIIGALAFIMLISSGIDGMKTLTYLGGTPITLVILGSVFSLIKLIKTKDALNNIE